MREEGGERRERKEGGDNKKQRHGGYLHRL
jgi:hypothetical protein